MEKQYVEKRKISLSDIFDYLIILYFVLCFFETYINGTIGPYLKYYILGIIVIQLIRYRNFKIHIFHFCVIIWFLLKLLSVFKIDNWYIFRLHFLSQIGMTTLLIVLTSVKFSESFLGKLVKSIWLASGLLGVFCLLFKEAYHGTFEARQVVVLFGVEDDPNNLAAQLLIGIAISLFFLIYKIGRIWLSCIILIVNCVSLFQTASRGGFVSMLAIILCIIILNTKEEKVINKITKIFFILSISIIIYFISKYFVAPESMERIFDFSGYSGGSSRNQIWGNILELIKNNFLLGAGWGAYYGYNGLYHATHNTYLSILSDGGIIGLLLFSSSIVYSIYYSIKRKFLLSIIILISGLAPSFFIDAINKRFFWNAIIISIMLIRGYGQVHKKRMLSYETNISDK